MPDNEEEERACQHERWAVAKKRYQAGFSGLEPDRYGELHVCKDCGWSRTVVRYMPDGGADVSQWSPR